MVPQQGEAAVARVAPATQPNGTPQLGEVHPARRPLLSANQDATPVAKSPLRRQNPREEPGALGAHAGICAGGEEQSSSLPRPSATCFCSDVPCQAPDASGPAGGRRKPWINFGTLIVPIRTSAGNLRALRLALPTPSGPRGSTYRYASNPVIGATASLPGNTSAASARSPLRGQTFCGRRSAEPMGRPSQARACRTGK